MSYLYTAGATGEEQRGPVDLSTLVQLALSGELSWEALVWEPSFADWLSTPQCREELVMGDHATGPVWRDSLTPPIVKTPPLTG